MPEGHSVHRLARQFGDVFTGERLAVSSPQGRFSQGAALLDGHTLVGSTAHGKHLFLEFEHGLLLHVHLGLYGAWDFGGDDGFRGASSIGAPRRVGEREIYADDDPAQQALYAGPPAPVGAVRVRLAGAHGWADLRGATTCEAITAAEGADVLARLGPDPLRNLPGDRDSFTAAVLAKRTPLAALLMDQKVIAGVGNVYRAELLFRQGLDP
ncbi:MAG: DNA-formamidopyrimidine glycosylase family protein, partial [Arthrobacter sp.]